MLHTNVGLQHTVVALHVAKSGMHAPVSFAAASCVAAASCGGAPLSVPGLCGAHPATQKKAKTTMTSRRAITSSYVDRARFR